VTDNKPSGSLDDEIERTLLLNRRLFFADEVNQESATEAIRKLCTWS